MPALARRAWVPSSCEDLVQRIAADTASRAPGDTAAELDRLIAANRRIHERDCINLNPATNTMNPRAEAALGAGLGQRPSLGYPGDKYEMGLEAIERSPYGPGQHEQQGCDPTLSRGPVPQGDEGARHQQQDRRDEMDPAERSEAREPGIGL